MRRRLQADISAKGKLLYQDSVKDWMRETSIELSDAEYHLLAYKMFKIGEEFFLNEPKQELNRIPFDPKAPKTSRGAALHRWIRFKLNDYYLIGNLPKKQALMTRPGEISVHILDASTYLKNIKLAKDLIMNPHSGWIWDKEGTVEYLEWRRLMSRWNSFANKTTPIQDLKVKPTGLTG